MSDIAALQYQIAAIQHALHEAYKMYIVTHDDTFLERQQQYQQMLQNLFSQLPPPSENS